MIKKLIVSLCLGFLFHTGFSQHIDKEKLDSYFEALEGSDKFYGSVAVVKNGQIVYTKSIGYADIESKTKADKESKYRIGSISKTFTSVLILKAIEEKKINLETTLNSFFPSIKNAEKITISHLLSHRSGIHNFTNDAEYLEWYTQAKTEQEMIELIAKGGSDFEPNSKADYSNANYVLLSYILEKVYKKPYADILQEKIIQVVNLKNTYVGKKINLKNKECNSYSYSTAWEKENETDMTIPMGAGNIVSTPSDLAIFSSALFHHKIISAQTVDAMTTLNERFGYGIFQMPFDDKKSFGHTGGIDGFSSVFGFFASDDIGFSIISNANNYNINTVTLVVLSAIFDKAYEIPNFKSYTLSSEDLDPYLGVYADASFPLKITISKNGNVLMAQATGQGAFSLEASEKNIFKFDQAGIVLEFKPENKTMTLKQGGGVFTLTKE
ncbi:MAG: serine hydrolase domain-containing protein [Chitinophagaceae bacterium]